MRQELKNAFGSATEVILGKRLELPEYANWLKEHTLQPIVRKSALGEKTTYVANLIYNFPILHRMATLEEALEHGKKSIPREAVDSLSLKNAPEALAGIKATTSDAIVGTNIAVEECGLVGNSSFCSSGFAYVHSKYCAYCFWPRQSEYAFGCSYLFSSKFCINCYYSVNLTRCFEMSDCNSCSDSYFCHNSENLQNCMLCFNTKSKSYAIGNVEVGKERYMRIRKILLGEIVAELEKEKALSLSIYNLGCRNSL